MYLNLKKEYQRLLELKQKRKKEIGKTHVVSRSIQCGSDVSKPFSFGVIGTGHVFDKWMHDLLLLPKEANIHVKGIFSNDTASANIKAELYHIAKIYGSYSEMLSDPEIDAVYIATPNTLHHDNAIEALKSGKHVLCEKPIAVNTKELEEMYSAANTNERFLMEGMWMRTLPMIKKLVSVVERNEVGMVKLIETSCCNSNDPSVYTSLYSPERAGGALMDVGCYGLHFVRLFMNQEAEIISASVVNKNNVDIVSSAVLKNNNQLAIVTQSIGAEGGAHAIIHGTKGSIYIPLFLSPITFTITKTDGFRHYYKYSQGGPDYIGYAYEIVHFADCIRNKCKNSSLIPQEDTLNIASQMEQIRRNSDIKLGSELL